MALWWKFAIVFLALACEARRIDHVVVVMLENRCVFFLKIDGSCACCADRLRRLTMLQEL
jgi:hypothetical protein